MAGEYARGTEVPPEKSRLEIERMLVRYGAKEFVSGWAGDEAKVMFVAHGRRVCFTLRFPARADKRFAGAGGEAARTKRWEAEVRRLWRTLAMVVKAKLEVVSSGISSFEDEFLAHVVVPGTGGETVGDQFRDALAQVYAGRPMPPLLGMGSS